MRDSNAEPPRSMHRALVDLLRWLSARDYRFTTVTPDTQARVLARRPGDVARNLRDIFGWSLPFEQGLLEPDVFAHLTAAGLIDSAGGLSKSQVRVTSLRGRLFVHSAYPTDHPDAVFFGPDSVRFTDFLVGDLQADPIRGRLLDIGAGSGVGAITAAELVGPGRVTLTDINATAIAVARANAQAAGLEIETVLTADAREIASDFAVILANPPFIEDAQRLTYRHGGGQLGAQVALDWTAQALAMLAPGGRFLLYSGSAIVEGKDGLRAGLEALVADGGFAMTYRELDPDIFGEQLSEPAYAEVERIAAIGARIDRL